MNTDRHSPQVWERVDELLALGDPPPPELRAIAGWRASERGDTETAERFQDDRRAIAFGSVSVRPLLERIRAATGQPMLLLKGPETAAVYPVSGVRPYGDLDLLMPDTVQAEADLLAVGFRQWASPLSGPVPWHHHRIPLHFGTTPLSIELHRDPGWLTWMTPPSNAELFARSVPSVTRVDGVVALPSTEATLFLAMHSWRHGPYHSLLHMIDIELMRQRADPAALDVLARRWGIGRVWQHTTRLLDWCFHDPSLPLSPLERMWSAHIRSGRARSRRAAGIAIRTKSLAAPSPRIAIRSIGTDVERTFTPLEEESFSTVVSRRIRNLRGWF